MAKYLREHGVVLVSKLVYENLKCKVNMNVSTHLGMSYLGTF